jgi:hypothetical protein
MMFRSVFIFKLFVNILFRREKKNVNKESKLSCLSRFLRLCKFKVSLKFTSNVDSNFNIYIYIYFLD